MLLGGLRAKADVALIGSSRAFLAVFDFTISMGSLAFLRLSEHQPVAMLPSAVVRFLPFGVDDWSFANLHYAIAWHESDSARRIYQIDMRPLIAMVMDIIGDLAEQNAFSLQYAIRLAKEWWERVSESVMVFFR